MGSVPDKLLLGAPFVLLAVVGFPAFGARDAAATRAHTSSAGKALTTKISYVETNHGHSQGSSTVGIQGHGTFSVRLSAHSALEAAAIALATGIPLPRIAQGGSYTLEHSDDRGIAVVKFKAHGLGAICVSYSARRGKFVPGDSFVPTTGSLKAIGGTGPAAKWSGGADFKQTNLTGTGAEQFTFTGNAHGSTGKARAMTAACKHVAAIHG